jgi:predicted nucleic acid-binding protein
VILVDSTVWIALLRKQQSVPVARLRKLLELGEAAAAPVIAQEVLQGAANPTAFAKLRKYFTGIPMIGTRRVIDLHVAAADLYARARWQAITPRSPNDCLIAATAVDEGVALLHDDRDFEDLAAIEPALRLLPRR